MNYYECTIITRPDVNSEKIITIFKNELWSCGFHDEKIYLKDMGKKHLAYDVKGHAEGYYWIIYFEGVTSKQMEQFEKVLKDNSYVLKFLILKTEPSTEWEWEDKIHDSVPLNFNCSQSQMEVKSDIPKLLDILFSND